MMVSAMDKLKDKVLDIIDSLYPDFTEYAVNANFNHWMEYACELDTISVAVWTDTGDGSLIDYLNKRLLQLRSSSAEHDACVDVASTLEETLQPQFKGVFKYE